MSDTAMSKGDGKGRVTKVAGPAVTVADLNPGMYDVVLVGKERLMGEVIRLVGGKAVVQVYEDTAGIRPGEPVEGTGKPLTVRLGPGLLGGIYDGIQRPLQIMRDRYGDFIGRGITADAIDSGTRWEFTPSVKRGDVVAEGQFIGSVQENRLEHRVLVPPRARGAVKGIREGKLTVEDEVCELDDGSVLTMAHDWPVRRGRPFVGKRRPDVPMVTGQRVIDTLFPVAKGGTASIPGGFGTGKCVSGETSVLLADGRERQIGELFDDTYDRGKGTVNETHDLAGRRETIIGLREGIRLRSFDGRGIVESVATHLYRGATDAMLDITLADGGSISVTPVHRLHVLRGDEVQEVEAAALRPGSMLLSLERSAWGHASAIEQHEYGFRKVSAVRWRGGGTVYDLTVPVYHNFAGGEGVFLHNTVTQQQLAKWSDVDVVIYVGCGERGNEMTEVLTTFPFLEDPRTRSPMMGRTILIANTSNMPIAAREASVYTGMALGEYYRDMGYDVSLMADSTSRWAEAMREISSRMEEMPGEEGFPAYLSARLSDFYERAGKVETLSGRHGSITVIGAVSPSGGDLSEPVTQNTLRITKTLWALDSKLRERRHFPAINWLTSYSLYTEQLDQWYMEKIDPDFPEMRRWALTLLKKEAELQEIVQLVGSDALPTEQQLLLEIASMLREFFLQQSAFHPVDTYSPMARQFAFLGRLKRFADLAERAVAKGTPLEKLTGLSCRNILAKLKFDDGVDGLLKDLPDLMDREFGRLEEENAA